MYRDSLNINDLLPNPVYITWIKDKAVLKITPEQFNIPIENLKLSSRTLTHLKQVNIHKIGELFKYDKTDLLKIRNFGSKSLENIYSRFIDLELPIPFERKTRQKTVEKSILRLLKWYKAFFLNTGLEELFVDGGSWVWEKGDNGKYNKLIGHAKNFFPFIRKNITYWEYLKVKK